jgi:EpsD family peptidyl-prolyl cis-trans isomerase
LTKRRLPSTSRIGLLVAGGAALFIAACDNKASSQDIAVGDGFKLARAEYAHILSQMPPVPESGLPAARKAVLDKLIDEKLLADAAEKDGVDRESNTVLQLEATRRSVLARAYLEKITRSVSAPTDQEVSDYYQSHRDLFASRVEGTFEQIAFTGDPKIISQYRNRLAADDAVLPELVARAAADKVTVSRNMIERSSDQLPPATATRLKTAQIGDSFLNAGESAVELVTIRALRPAPLSLEQAKPMIQAKMTTERKDRVAKAELEKLRARAKVKVLDPQLAK